MPWIRSWTSLIRSAAACASSLVPKVRAYWRTSVLCSRFHGFRSYIPVWLPRRSRSGWAACMSMALAPPNRTVTSRWTCQETLRGPKYPSSRSTRQGSVLPLDSSRAWNDWPQQRPESETSPRDVGSHRDRLGRLRRVRRGRQPPTLRAGQAALVGSRSRGTRTPGHPAHERCQSPHRHRGALGVLRSCWGPSPGSIGGCRRLGW